MSEYNIQMNKYNALNVEYDQLYPATKIKNVDGLNEALQNKAPAGYGLGTVAKKITDWNAANVGGWYECDAGAANSPDENSSWFGFVYASGNPDVFIQEVFTLENVDKYIHRKRLYYPGTGTGTPWEWVDPPMYLGVEYRTTERYQGKPVYALFDNFGPNTNEAVMYYGNNVKEVVYGIANDGNGSTYPWYNGLDVNSWSVWFSFQKGTDPSDSVSKVKVTCFAGSSASSSYAANTVLVKYTKITD